MTLVARIGVAERRVVTAAMARHELVPDYLLDALRLLRTTKLLRGVKVPRDKEYAAVLLDWRKANNTLHDACDALELLRARVCPVCNGHGAADAWGPMPDGLSDGDCPGGCDNGEVRT